MKDLKRTALVTGAGGGLGHATVERLVAGGWKVFEADISREMLRSSMHDPDVIPVVMDVTDADSIQSAFDAVSSQTDRLEAIVNFAGVMGVGSLVDIPEERLTRIFDINVLGTYRVNKKFFPMVEKVKGRIVNISSEAGWQSAAPFVGPYAMSKVITVQPGSFRTNMVSGIEDAFALAATESQRFGKLLDKLKGLAVKAAGSAGDPDMLAQVIQTALTARNPKPVYSVKPDKLRSALERMPVRAADEIYLTVMRRGAKN
jgi:NAD(P)-dependent dehydrogenase (short-subunit alcohol dehydrogenase family)